MAKMILTKKKKGFYILNIFNGKDDINLDDSILDEINKIISKINRAKTRIALDLSNVSAITSIDFLSFIRTIESFSHFCPGFPWHHADSCLPYFYRKKILFQKKDSL